eukprot:6172280-Pleurochrysis_carterae.AAC.1
MPLSEEEPTVDSTVAGGTVLKASATACSEHTGDKRTAELTRGAGGCVASSGADSKCVLQASLVEPSAAAYPTPAEVSLRPTLCVQRRISHATPQSFLTERRRRSCAARTRARKTTQRRIGASSEEWRHCSKRNSNNGWRFSREAEETRQAEKKERVGSIRDLRTKSSPIENDQPWCIASSEPSSQHLIRKPGAADRLRASGQQLNLEFNVLSHIVVREGDEKLIASILHKLLK